MSDYVQRLRTGGSNQHEAARFIEAQQATISQLREELAEAKEFHADSKCAACEGPLEADRDAICHKCTDQWIAERVKQGGRL